MKTSNDIFEHEFVTFARKQGSDADYAHKALQMGDRIFEAVKNRSYLKTELTQLERYVRSALSHLDENDLIDLFPDKEAPWDARICLTYEPSYAVAALAIYLKNRLGNTETAWMDDALPRLLTAAFRNGIAGHGYEAAKMRESTMLMFCRAGLKRFLEADHQNYNSFCDFMRDEIAYIRKAINVGSGSSREPRYAPSLMQILAAYEEKETPVFVYGTLMRGERANAYVQDSIYGGNAALRDYVTVDLGSYPGIVEREGEAVVGELYYADEETVRRLDAYESEGSLYVRKPVRVKHESGDVVTALAYIYAQPIRNDAAPVRARWNMRADDEVWYAAYGSNLSAERFRYYILGGSFRGRPYPGCKNKALWTADKIATVSGRMYFGNSSSRWDGGGVAFFDQGAEGTTTVRLYRITFGQLKDVQAEEHATPDWYGRLVFLGFSDGVPMYTFTSETRREFNAPCDDYLRLIHDALISECGLKASAAQKYLEECC